MTEQNVLVDLKQVSEGFFLLLFLFLLFFFFLQFTERKLAFLSMMSPMFPITPAERRAAEGC